MPTPPKPPPTMDAYVRKGKPRAVTSARPSHTVTPAPRALVAANARISPAPPPEDILPTLPRVARVRVADRASRVSATAVAATAAAAAANVPASPPAPKPRKRFRKKVNGLFGDQTDLKKRMSKLLRHTDAGLLLSADVTVDRPGHAGVRRPLTHTVSTALPPAAAVIEKLKASAMAAKKEEGEPGVEGALVGSKGETGADKMADGDHSLDSFESPAFVATASRALGSPEKLRAVRKSMGRLSPRSNERFIEELQLGQSPSSVKREGASASAIEDDLERIKPPDLPSVNSSEFETEEREAMREAIFSMSPVSVERTGAPAVLRRKARRLDRGYRSADVLRARLQGTPLSEFAASPTTHRRSEKVMKWPRMKVRRLDLSQGDERGRKHGEPAQKRSLSERLRVEESQEDSDDSGEVLSSDGAPPKKRRLRSGSRVAGNETEDRAAGSARAFAMLVEAAGMQQKQTSLRSKGRSAESQSRREERPDASARRTSKERRRKKRTPTPGFLASE